MTDLVKLTKQQKLLIMIGAMSALFLAALDQTIVATATPKIVAEFNGFDKLTWIFTAYMLAATITVPIYGKLSDIYGRRIFYLLAIVIFLIGSIFSGVSQNMIELILARAVQGIGAGSIMANSFAIIGDLFVPAERSRWQGLFAGAWGLASVVGPTLGGYFTDHISWRWNFFINIPIGILSFAFIYFLMPKIITHAREKSIDYIGAIFLTLTLISLLLGFVWGGSQYAWQSWQEIGLFVLSFFSLCAFIANEKKAEDPIIPLTLFQNPIFTTSMILVFISGVAMFGIILYIPLFAQIVLGISATNSGAILTPLTLGLVIASVVSGQISSHRGTYKSLIIFGIEMMTLGVFLLSRMDIHTSPYSLALFMIISGIGMGITLPLFTVIVQNAFDHSKLGVVTASTQLFRSIGGTVGTAVMGSIVNNALHQKLSNLSGDIFISTYGKYISSINIEHLSINQIQLLVANSKQATSQLAKLPNPINKFALLSFSSFIEKVRIALSSSIAEIYAIATLLLLLAIGLSYLLKEIPLKEHNQPIKDGEIENLDKATGSELASYH